MVHFGPSLEKGADRRFDLILPSAKGSGAGALGGSGMSSALDYALIREGGAVMGTPHRNGSDDAEAILRAQLDFARAMVGNLAESAEAYQLMWGPLGGPMVGAMQTALRAQRLYLEELRKTVD